LKLTIFFELRSRKAARFSEQIMSADKYPRVFLRKMEAIVYVSRGRSFRSKRYRLDEVVPTFWPRENWVGEREKRNSIFLFSK